MRPHRVIPVLLLACVAVSAFAQPPASLPNILLIVADDLGYADLGCYGGDIRTPTLDKLASEGLLLTNFHTAPSCAPTRAMLLSGNNNHAAGMGRQGGARNDWEASQPGYEGYLSDRVIPFPQLLSDAGYHTYTAGKWHLGKKPENSPKAKGFERSFSLLQGASNHYNNTGLISADSVSLYSADGKLVDYPTGRYSTEFYTERLMEFIREGKRDGKPFFAFAAYTSPHWPLQAPAANDRYRGRYEMGYDSLRVLRFESLKKAGIIPKDSKLPPQLESIKPWSSLTAEERKTESRKMELYAAMVDHLDEQLKKLVDFLKKERLYDNTIIVFMSDNGAGAEDFFVQRPYADFIAPRHDNRYENMGKPNSFVSYGPPWAKAGAAPFSHHKGYATEGGTRAPLIIAGEKWVNRRGIRHEFLTVMDLAPTFLELAGVVYPGNRGTATTRPMLGSSLRSYLDGSSTAVHDSTYVFGLWSGGYAGFWRGRWKLANKSIPYREDRMQLFDLVSDPGETTDLSAKRPATYQAMVEAWRQYLQAHDIRLPAAKD
ncbi:MAG: sulfatase-like hydrolase/transferase [Cyclobacteriaceae bacterium]|nr:sulfatase-like hydrolase/transferase [Cyclobacteriaceae bacterium]